MSTIEWRDEPTWPVHELALGNVSYNEGQLRDILDYPGFPNDGLNPLARELIAAKLNIAAGAGHDCVDEFITQADSIIGHLVPKPVGDDTIPMGNVQELVRELANYNKGELCCATHCSATSTPTPTATATPTPDPTTTPTATPTATATPTVTPSSTPTASPTPTTTPTATPTPCQLDIPSIACGTSAASNIAIDVTVGASGAPNGFVIEWMTEAEFIASGSQWPDNPDDVCQAGFPNGLAPNQTLEVVIGDDRLFDSVGVRSDCSGDPLLCDTAYVFRCRVEETESCEASPWGNTTACATLPCNPGQNCTYTQGYWKNHPDVWPVQNLMLGAVSYNASQLLQVLNRPAQGNGLVILAHQLIASKLNIANGANPAAVQQSIIDADSMIGGLIVPPIGNGYLSPGQTSELIDTLTEYNEGTIGPGHCND
jgi:hypothetical protein